MLNQVAEYIPSFRGKNLPNGRVPWFTVVVVRSFTAASPMVEPPERKGKFRHTAMPFSPTHLAKEKVG